MMSREHQPYNYGRYERNRKNQKFFTFLKMISLPLLLMVLAVPLFIFYKAHKQLNSPAPQTSSTEIAKASRQQTNNSTTDALPLSTAEKQSTQSKDPLPGIDDGQTADLQPKPEPIVKTVSVDQTSQMAATDTKDPLTAANDPLARETIETPQTTKPLVIDASDPLAEQLRKTSQALLADITRVEGLLEKKKMEVQLLEKKLDSARQLLDSQPIINAETPNSTQPQPALAEPAMATTRIPADSDLLDEFWLESQNPEAFVIQIASSTDIQALADYVGNITTNDPKAIYPFQATRDGDLVYGASIGVHTSRELAVENAIELADSQGLNGAWVRPIREISAQVETVKGLN